MFSSVPKLFAAGVTSAFWTKRGFRSKRFTAAKKIEACLDSVQVLPPCKPTWRLWKYSKDLKIITVYTSLDSKTELEIICYFVDFALNHLASEIQADERLGELTLNFYPQFFKAVS